MQTEVVITCISINLKIAIRKHVILGGKPTIYTARVFMLTLGGILGNSKITYFAKLPWKYFFRIYRSHDTDFRLEMTEKCSCMSSRNKGEGLSEAVANRTIEINRVKKRYQNRERKFLQKGKFNDSESGCFSGNKPAKIKNIHRHTSWND